MSPLEMLTTPGENGMNLLDELRHSFDSQFVISFGGTGLTQYILWMLITATLTVVVVLVGARKDSLIPTNKFAHTIEFLYHNICGDMGTSAIGKGYQRHMTLIATFFFFILVSNFVGLIPGCKTPTGSLSVTWALSTVSFFYFNYQGIKARGGWGYIKSIAPAGLPVVMVPIIWFFELISLVLRWLTLAVRLYGNMFAGHMVLGIFSLMTYVFVAGAIQQMNLILGLPAIAWMALLIVMYALETLVAFLQAYVFAVLSASYVGLATSEH